MRPRRRRAAGHPPALPLPPLRGIRLKAKGPEDVVTDARGRVLTGVEDGRVLRIEVSPADGPARVEEITRTGGRPLGLEPLPGGELLVCDAERGLLRITPRTPGAELDERARTDVLVDTVAGARLRFCSNAVAAVDGTVYFTVSSRRFGLEDWLRDIVEHVPTGRLIRLAPGGEPEVLLDDLQFANGVALAPDESFVVVAETGAYRLARLWLSGPRAGERDLLIDGLPGFPDNLSRAADGTIWTALAGPRTAPLDWLHRAPLSVRRPAGQAAQALGARPGGTAHVIGVGCDGRVRHHLKRRSAAYRMVTSVCERDGLLVLGSLVEEGIALCDVPGPPPAGRARSSPLRP